MAEATLVQRNDLISSASPMKLAGAAWSWVGATMAESAAIYRAIGVEALDLIAIPGSRFDTYHIAGDSKRHARQAKELDIALSNLLLFFGVGFHDRALNDPDSSIRGRNFETFRRIVDFASDAGFYSITVLPGVEHSPHSRHDDLERTAAELHRLRCTAEEAGVLLVYEPHVESVLDDPRLVQNFIQTRCDVRLVIDYSHFVSAGYACEALEPLVPYAGHVHLRQAAPDQIQARWQDGTIDYPKLIGALKRSGYRGYLTLEYEHDKFWNMDRCDVMTETIRMRDAVLPYLA